MARAICVCTLFPLAAIYLWNLSDLSKKAIAFMAPPACRRHRRTDKDAGRRSVRRSKLKEINSFVMSTLDSEIDPRMDQRLEDCVLDKTRYSSFYNTSLEVILRGLDVDTLIICRVTT